MTPAAEECRLLHRHLFGGEPAPDLLARYEALHARSFSGAEDLALTRFLVEARPDVGALEYALRRGDKKNGLTRRMTALCYLHEAGTPADLEAPGFLGAALAFVRIAFIAPWALIKGLFLLRRHGLGR